MTKINFLKSAKQHLDNGNLVVIDDMLVSEIDLNKYSIKFKGELYTYYMFDKMCLDDDLPQIFENAYYISKPIKEKIQ